MAEIDHALHEKAITLHTKIKYRWEGVDEKGKPFKKWYDTTPGRVVLGNVLPKSVEGAVRHRQPLDDQARDLRR